MAYFYPFTIDDSTIKRKIIQNFTWNKLFYMLIICMLTFFIIAIMSSSLIGCPIHSALCQIEAKSFVNYYRIIAIRTIYRYERQRSFVSSEIVRWLNREKPLIVEIYVQLNIVKLLSIFSDWQLSLSHRDTKELQEITIIVEIIEIDEIFKTWTGLFAFHLALIHLSKAWIHLFSSY